MSFISRVPREVEIQLGDFNVSMGKEGIFGTTIGNFSLSDETCPNGLRLIGVVGARNKVVCILELRSRKYVRLCGCRRIENRSIKLIML